MLAAPTALGRQLGVDRETAAATGFAVQMLGAREVALGSARSCRCGAATPGPAGCGCSPGCSATPSTPSSWRARSAAAGCGPAEARWWWRRRPPAAAVQAAALLDD
jgi:hypothetical protein